MSYPRKWSQAEIDFIRSCPEFTDRQFAELYNTTINAVSALRKRKGIKKSQADMGKFGKLGGRPKKVTPSSYQCPLCKRVFEDSGSLHFHYDEKHSVSG